MSNELKNIKIKNHTYFFLNYIINIKDFDPNNIKIGEVIHKVIQSYKYSYLLHCICDDQWFEICKN